MTPRRAFTIIELLVAIAIIALLVGLILPVLSRARTAGERTECAAQMRDIGAAWQMFAQESDDEVPNAGVDEFVDGTTFIDETWPATMDLWHGEYPTPAWSGFGVLVAAELAQPQSFYCPAAMNNWVPRWDEYQSDYGEDALLIGAFDPAKVGLVGVPAMSTYYQRGPGHHAPERITDPGRVAILADAHHYYEDELQLNSHNDGVNALFNDGSVVFISCDPTTSIAYDADPLVPETYDPDAPTWRDLDAGEID